MRAAHRLWRAWGVAAGLVASMVGGVQAEVPAPTLSTGRYSAPHDGGSLTVRRDPGAGGRWHFDIETVGGNCHICGLSGRIVRTRQGWVGHTEEAWAERCDIALQPQGRDAVRVTALTPEACQTFCGARAGFEHTYRRPPAACSDGQRRARRERALASHRQGLWTPAAQGLQALLQDCAGFMDPITLDRVRSDLALVQWRLGEPAACRATLAGTHAAGLADEAALREAMAPCDADNYLPVARAIWFNLRRCQGGEAPGVAP